MHPMQELKDALKVIDTVIPQGSKIVYFEYPTYLNVGDLLIMEGTEAFFADRGHEIVARYSDKYCAVHRDELPAIDPQAIIVLQGGGNFGDLYTVHQRLREAVIRAYPNNRVVVFPQTAFFSDAQAMLASAECFKKHADVHIFARDSESAAVFQHFTDHVKLCPDMAHMLWDIYPRKQSSSANGAEKTFYMMRSDKEKIPLAPELEQAIRNPKDWRDICSATDRFVSKRLVRYAERLNSFFGRELIAVDKFWLSYTRGMIQRINTEWLEYDQVITSRMHGHILACLLGLKTQLIDNSYGKNSAYYRHWTSRVAGCDLIQAYDAKAV